MKYSYILLFAFALFLISCNDDDSQVIEKEVPVYPGSLSLNVNHVFDNEDFELGKTYTNVNGEKVMFSQLRYWLSNIILTDTADQQVAIPNSYFLIEHAQGEVAHSNVVLPDTIREQINIAVVAPGVYNKIQFAIGVDAYYNDNLSRSAGELSLLQNMSNSSWMWHTSYLFSRADGELVVNSDTVSFKFDTGTNELYKIVEMELSQPLKIGDSADAFINIQCDVNKLFEGLSVSNLEKDEDGVFIINATTPTNMAQLANNYSLSYSLK